MARSSRAGGTSAYLASRAIGVLSKKRARFRARSDDLPMCLEAPKTRAVAEMCDGIEGLTVDLMFVNLKLNWLQNLAANTLAREASDGNDEASAGSVAPYLGAHYLEPTGKHTTMDAAPASLQGGAKRVHKLGGSGPQRAGVIGVL